MRKILIVILVAAALSIAGCHGGGLRLKALNDLADMVESAPDSALTAIDAALAEATTQRDSDRLAGLRAFARYRLYIDDTYQTDSLIAPAADRLYNHADKEDRRFAIIAAIMDSHVGRNSDNRERALRSALRAEDLAQDANFPALSLLMGRIYNAQAFAFLAYDNRVGLKIANKKAAHWYLIAGDTLRSIKQTVDYAQSVAETGDTSAIYDALEILDSLQGNYSRKLDDFNNMVLHSSRMNLMMRLRNYDRALEEANRVRHYALTIPAKSRNELSYSYLTSYRIFNKKGMTDSAQYYFEKVQEFFSKDTTLHFYPTYRINYANTFYDKGDWEEAARLYKKIVTDQFRTINRYGAHTTDYILLSAIEHNHEKQMQTEQTKNLSMLIICTLIFLILALICYFSFRANVQREKELSENAITVLELQEELKELKEDSKKKDQGLKKRFFEHTEAEIQEINKLCAEFDKKFIGYEKFSALTKEQKNVYRELRNSMRTMIDTKCEALLNEYTTNHTNSILSKILAHSEDINLNEEGKKILLMDILGFRSPAIATILGIDLTTLYTRRSRIKSRINEKNILSREELLQLHNLKR